MPRLELEDVTLNYEFDPLDPRPVLVLSNSLGTSLSMWASQVQHFSQHFSLLCYDSRGQGQSSVPAGPYDIATMSNDVLCLLDALNLDRVHFCGLSMGGMVGQWIGAHAAHRLGRLVLSNTAAKVGTIEGWNQRIDTVQRDGMQAIIPTVLRVWFTPRFHMEHPTEIARMGTILHGNDPLGYAASCAAVRDMDQRETAATISAPTLVVYGTEDRSTSPAEAKFLLDRIPGAEALELSAAHIANIEAASAFKQGVLQFLLKEEL